MCSGLVSPCTVFIWLHAWCVRTPGSPEPPSPHKFSFIKVTLTLPQTERFVLPLVNLEMCRAHIYTNTQIETHNITQQAVSAAIKTWLALRRQNEIRNTWEVTASKVTANRKIQLKFHRKMNMKSMFALGFSLCMVVLVYLDWFVSK